MLRNIQGEEKCRSWGAEDSGDGISRKVMNGRDVGCEMWRNKKCTARSIWLSGVKARQHSVVSKQRGGVSGEGALEDG